MILTPLSALYRSAVRFRHYLYDRRILSKEFTGLPTVSIGNVMAGGTGKTQAALLLTKQLSESLRVAILTRGYRGGAEHASEPLLVDTQEHSAAHAGDEPWLLAKRSGALVIVNKNRFKSALKAQKLGADILILDDGMQHRKLHRDFEIVVIDGKSAFGSFLPKGRRRDELERLSSADLILFVGEPENAIEQEVALHTVASTVSAHIVPTGVFMLSTGASVSLDNQPIAIFCGIGNPSRFVKTVEGFGAHVVATHFSSDHCLPNEKTLRKFALLAKERGAAFLLCTEKDAVKLSNISLPLPVVWMRVRLEIVKNRDAWTKMVDEMKFLAVGAR